MRRTLKLLLLINLQLWKNKITFLSLARWLFFSALLQ